MEKLLTIVVPAYNVEKYIKNCLDSFIDLSVLRSLEILIVDDGSTDSTASLAHTYEQKYPYSFKVLSKENGGHGSTINYAIPRATGKYFKVVDGDDWLDKSLLPQFVQLLKHTHSDVISNDFNLVDDRTKKVTKRRKAVSNSYHSVSYTHLRAHETGRNLVCRLLLEKKKTSQSQRDRQKARMPTSA